MTERENKKTSRFLSLVLRHKPETLGLAPDENGWVDVTDLLGKMNQHGFDINLERLAFIVETNNKQRFAFNETKTRIRANQGHSIGVNLNLKPVQPPSQLFHGTGAKYVDAILKEGIVKGERHHVHLSADKLTAMSVGKRHGAPRIFVVDAGMMHHQNHIFYRSENEVWLVEHVPPKYLQLLAV